MLHVDDGNVEEAVIKGNLPTLLEFGATWYGPCKMLEPTMAALAQEYGDQVAVGKVDIDEAPVTTQRFGINSLPTVVFVRGGREVHRVSGSPARAEIAELVQTYLLAPESRQPPSEASRPQDAAQAHAGGDEEAETRGEEEELRRMIRCEEHRWNLTRLAGEADRASVAYRDGELIGETFQTRLNDLRVRAEDLRVKALEDHVNLTLPTVLGPTSTSSGESANSLVQDQLREKYLEGELSREDYLRLRGESDASGAT